MKKMFLSLAFLFACSMVQAQSVSVVEGKWERPAKAPVVKLFAVSHGSLVELAASTVSADGRFALAFYPPEEGFYVFGLHPQQARHRYIFYFKPGDQLNFRVTDTGYELVGKNTPENEALARWQQFIEPLDVLAHAYTPETRSATYVDFFPVFEEKEQQMASFPVVKTKNARFNELFPQYRNIDFLSKANAFIFSPRSEHPQGMDYPDYFRELDAKSFAQEPLLLDYPEGVRLFTQIPMLQIYSNGDLTQQARAAMLSGGVEGLILGDEELMAQTDPVLRGELALMFAHSKRNIEAFQIYDEKFGKYIHTEAQQKAYDDIRNPLMKTEPAVAATDFAFNDKDGKRVAVSDFKGKVVYIDVWATWCGPCKAEIPHLKKLEAEYEHNDNIVFIGVSTDRTRDKEKWEKFLVDEQLPGIQLFAGDDARESLMKPYNITGIPRFILVGKDGNLIYADAPRPSSQEIRTVLNNALK